jgi:hypothetical protein
MKTYALIDLSVFLHVIHDKKRDYANKPADVVAGIKNAQLAWLLSCEFLRGYVPDGEPIYPLILRDQKAGTSGYWIHQYLLRPEVYSRIPRYGKRIDKSTGQASRLKAQPVKYKGHRGPSQPSYVSLVNAFDERLAKSGVPQLRKTGFEADHWLGALCNFQLNKPVEERDRIIIVTTDSDHLGCVNEQVSWFCMVGHKPRVRANMASISEWSQRRLKAKFERPRELWDYKAKYGDKSDNLPPGSPIEVIDLLNPPLEFNLLNNAGAIASIEAAFESGWLAPKQDAERARRYLRRAGCQPFPRPFNAEMDILAA